jgi:uncharacterized integral membrane protein
MLSFLKFLLAVAVMAVILVIGLQNANTHVGIDLSPIRRYTGVSLSLALFYAYLAGLITFALVYFFQGVRMRAQLSRLRKENRKLAGELQQLRSVALEDLPVKEEADQLP